MIISRATEADIPRLREFRSDAAAWLKTRGTDQWSTPYPFELMVDSVTAGEVYLFRSSPEAEPTATVTLDRRADAALWEPEEALEPALYIHKLTLDSPGTGSGLGARILDWCGDQAYRSGASWIRLDAWTANRRLQSYYEEQGFSHVRTVLGPETYGSGWLAQRPARRLDRCDFVLQVREERTA